MLGNARSRFHLKLVLLLLNIKNCNLYLTLVMQHDVSCRISVSTFFISYTVYILQCVLFGVFYRFYYLPFLFPECTVYLTSLLYVNVYLSIFSYRCVCYITFTQSQRFSRDCNLVLDCEQSLFFFFLSFSKRKIARYMYERE